MAGHPTWTVVSRTKARKALDWLKGVRYWLAYRKRLKDWKKNNADIRSFKVPAEVAREVRDFWGNRGFGRFSMDWWRLYATVADSCDPRFVPEKVFRLEIEPYLNAPGLASAYSDKNVLQERHPECNQPTTVLRNIHGRYYDGDYKPLAPDQVRALRQELRGPYIVKPSRGTGGGCMVNRIVVEDGALRSGERVMNWEEVERFYGADFLVQEVIRQHAELASYHPDSVNTCRLISLRLDDAFRICACTFKMGNGMPVDNGHTGGLIAGVDVETGTILGNALDTSFRTYERHPMTGREFEGNSIPNFDAMKKMALSVHASMKYFDIVSFDIALEEDAEPCLVEANLLGQGVEPHQALKGRPLFDDDTKRVLDIVAERRESFRA